MMVGILLGDGPTRQVRWHVSKYRGKPVLLHTLEAMHRSNLDQILMVLGRDYHLILNRMRIPRDRVRLLMNHRFERGLSSYLKIALLSLPEDTSGVMLVPGEYCQLTPQIIDQLIASFTRNNRGILVPTYMGEQGFPTVFHKKFIRPLSRVRKDDLGQSILDNNPKEIIEEDITSPSVINSFSRIRATETSEIENVTFGKLEKAGQKLANGLKAAPRNGIPAAVKRDVPQPVKTQNEPKPQATQTDNQKADPPPVPVPTVPEKKLPAKPVSPPQRPDPTAKTRDHRHEVQNRNSQKDHPGEVQVPQMNRSKKKIIEKLKKKVEARVREEKQKIIQRRKSDEVETPSTKNREGDIPLEIPRRRDKRANTEDKPAAPDTGHLDQDEFREGPKGKDSFSLKMLNDLLGRGKEKK